ncbi:MAG: DNA cytosine methyltransferase, partial [Acinetobacter sp.]|nr:DNA cytosine methyltransferase [Acinetobacter sp.]
IRALERQGYKVEHRTLRACDYGAPTIRKRLFMIARSDGQPIVWPEATHGEGLIPYKTAADCIDWSIPCPSIFDRKRPLVENTMNRIARGLKKFVFDAQEPFIVTVNHSGDGFRGQGLNEPVKTLTSKGCHALVTPYLTEHANGSSQRIFDAQEPLRTQCAQVKGGHFALVAPVIGRHFGQSIGSDCRDPIGTCTATNKTSLCTAFLAKHFGGATGVEVDKPLPTILSRGTQTQIVTSHVMKMRGTNTGHDMNEPLHTISAGGTHHAEVRAFLLKYYGTATGSTLNDPMHSVTSKERFGLVTIKGQDYAIVDIGMRMLTPRELYRAQGFPEDYIIDTDYNGKPLTKTAQVRMCGNSVCPPVAKAIVQANMADTAILKDQKRKTNG